jgi:hypothetical protein
MSKHFTNHTSYSILGILKVMDAFQHTMHHHHVKTAKSKIKGGVLFLKSLFVLLILLEVDNC